MISLKQIRYALAVEEQANFKRAAEQCSISQSALSGAISDMETQLGFQLFERDTKKVFVTPLGQEVLDRARKISLDVQDLHALAEKIKAPMSGKFKLGMIPTIAPYLLPKVLPEIKTQFPDLLLVIEEEQSHTLVSRVKKGEIDSAILALPYDCEGLLSFTFWSEDFYLVTHANEALAKHAFVKSADLNSYDLLLLEDGHCLKDHALAACQLEAKHSELEIRANSLSTLVHLVANKMGATLVPEIALSQLLANQKELAAIKLEEPGPHRELAFIVRPTYPDLAKIENLKEMMKRCLNKHAS